VHGAPSLIFNISAGNAEFLAQITDTLKLQLLGSTIVSANYQGETIWRIRHIIAVS
jgi:hypothetical protein